MVLVGAHEVSTADQVLEAVAIDGKTLCGTLQAHERAVHLLVTAGPAYRLHVEPSLASTQKPTSTRGALEILKTLVLERRVITGDAMFCQRDVCEEIRGRGGHYFFVVKDNQPTL